eukprot:3615787-Rhodomonas_salina.4
MAAKSRIQPVCCSAPRTMQVSTRSRARGQQKWSKVKGQRSKVKKVGTTPVKGTGLKQTCESGEGRSVAVLVAAWHCVREHAAKMTRCQRTCGEDDDARSLSLSLRARAKRSPVLGAGSRLTCLVCCASVCRRSPNSFTM